MNRHRPRVRGFLPFILVLLALGMDPSGGPIRAAEPKKTPQKELVWPLPPEKPRVRWLTQYRAVEDFEGESGLRKFLRKLSGEKKRALFLYPSDVTTDNDHRIFVSDPAAHTIVVLDEKRKKVQFWRGGRIGLAGPTGLAYSKKKQLLYVADSPAQRVLALDRNGEVQLEIRDHLDRPGGLAVDDQRERLYVVDVRGHLIDVFDLDGTWLTQIGERGDQPGQFNFPNFITVDRKGFLYVSDMGNFRIQILSPEGEVINVFGEPGRRPGNLMRPKGIAVDSENHIYVVDAVFNNIQIFDIFGRVYLAVGTRGINAGEFILPAGLFIDDRDRILVVDQVNKRIQIFQYLASGETAPSPGG